MEIVRGPTASAPHIGTRTLEGSLFLNAVAAERLLRAERAHVVHVSSEIHGIPFFGTQVVATLHRRPAG